jgi:periplasmic divalent cation tolerance protein
MTDVIQVITTAGSQAEAERIAHALVERRLAACVQVSGPITSVYRWQGKIETGAEWRCAIKTRLANYPAVESAIRELHSYDVPEILALPVVAGGESYLAWLRGELSDPPDAEAT